MVSPLLCDVLTPAASIGTRGSRRTADNLLYVPYMSIVIFLSNPSSTGRRNSRTLFRIYRSCIKELYLYYILKKNHVYMYFHVLPYINTCFVIFYIVMLRKGALGETHFVAYEPTLYKYDVNK